MNQAQAYLLSLLSAAFNKTAPSVAIDASEWSDIFQLAKDHAVLPLAYAGASSVRDQIPAELLSDWRGIVFGMLIQNERLMNMQDKVLKWLRDAEIPCAVLKGSSHSVYYPNAEMRPLGDIDLLVLPADVERVSAILNRNGFFAPETDHPFHIDFYGSDTVLEVHYAVSDFPDSAGGRMAKQFMSAWLDTVQAAKLKEHVFPVLSTPHQALNQLLHMERHMTTSSIGLRQVYDWAMFVSAVSADSFVQEVLPVLQSCGMAQFAKVLTKTCICYLGIDAEHSDWCVDIDRSLADEMLTEVLRNGNINQVADEGDLSNVLVGRYGRDRRLVSLVKKLNSSAKRQFPVAAKCPVLLPFFWFYLPIRYWVRSKKGSRLPKAIGNSIGKAKSRERLYRKLKLYQNKN